MKLIKDIRLFELDVPNVDYNPTPYYIGKIYHYDHMDSLPSGADFYSPKNAFTKM